MIPVFCEMNVKLYKAANTSRSRWERFRGGGLCVCVCVCVQKYLCTVVIGMTFAWLGGHSRNANIKKKNEWHVSYNLLLMAPSPKMSFASGCPWPASLKLKRFYFSFKIVPTKTVYQSKDSCNRRSSDSISWNAAQLALFCEKAALLAGNLAFQWKERAGSEWYLFVHFTN